MEQRSIPPQGWAILITSVMLLEAVGLDVARTETLGAIVAVFAGSLVALAADFAGRGRA